MRERSANPDVHNVSDLFTDLSRTHSVETDREYELDNEIADFDLKALSRDGYLVIPDLLEPAELDALRREFRPLLGPVGRNSFEGHRTQRAYSLLRKTRAADRLVEHPRVQALLERLLRPNYQLSQLSVINILPGESPQLLHADDIFYPVPRPRRALSAATIWALDDFTEDNGATVVLPGSHRWGEGREPTDDDPRVSAVMPAGSCVFFLGTLWHGGGANRSDRSRLSLTAQYCEPWLRTLEAFTLSVDTRTARTVSDRIRRMIGYSVYPPFVGSVDGMHPERLLERNHS